MHFLADSTLPDSSPVIISLVLLLVVITIIGTVVTIGLICIKRFHLCAKQEMKEQQEVVYDEVMYSKDREQIRLGANEAYQVLPKMEGNVAYGLTRHQSSEVSSH